MRRNLKQHAPHYEIHITSDAKKVLDIIREKGISVLITDILMPEKDGIQLIRETLQNYPSLKIITMSGGGRIDGETYLRLSEDLGAMQSLKKPFSQQELLDAIEKAGTR